MQAKTIVFYKNNRGEKVVQTFIATLSTDALAKVSHALDLLESYTFRLGMPFSKKVSTSLFELRIRGSQQIRIFYAFQGKEIIILHAFIKKTQKLPKNEINIAEKRLLKYKRITYML